ncbi:MAG TPA: hypothetical protein VK209_02770 [Candidatus Sulfotelmatobacter sp.]|nr:hypothetical protein [Candidatus Sulfotelmatobacter sp.]
MTGRKTPLISIIVIATIGLLTTVLTAAAVNSNPDPRNEVTSFNVDLYTDASCTTPCKSLDFGAVNPGSTITKTIYVKNDATIPMTLSMTSSGWNPKSARSCLTLSWNRANYVLNAGSSVQATLTLAAASNTGTLTTFSFNVTITGRQATGKY